VKRRHDDRTLSLFPAAEIACCRPLVSSSARHRRMRQWEARMLSATDPDTKAWCRRQMVATLRRGAA
jgi:hypothetical protein